jgi:ubiquinone biosynthesis protein
LRSWNANRSAEFAAVLAALRDEIAASDLLPEAYRRYRPLLADGLVHFLERLPPVRLSRIFEEQMCLPSCVSTAQRVVALAHHAPALHKLGQVMARDRRLAGGFRRRLQELESLEPRTPREDVTRQLEQELPGWEKAGIELGPQSLAEGSVAVVMPFGRRHASAPPLPGNVDAKTEEEDEAEAEQERT